MSSHEIVKYYYFAYYLTKCNCKLISKPLANQTYLIHAVLDKINMSTGGNSTKYYKLHMPKKIKNPLKRHE